MDTIYKFFLRKYTKIHLNSITMHDKDSESPPTKRCKLTESENFKVKAILPNDYTDTSLEKVYITKIVQKQQISGLMKELSQCLPLPNTLQHLKRVRQNEIIICRTGDVKEGLKLKEHLSGTLLNVETIELLCSNKEVIEVPASACRLRIQYESMRSYWPCKFHPDKYLESLYDGTCFTNDQMDFHKLITDLLLELSCDLESLRPCGVCVDPRTNTIVSIASSRTELNPLYHAPMVLIDFVARTQNPCVLNEQLTEEFVANSSKDLLDSKPLIAILQKYWNFIKKNNKYKMLDIGAEPIRLKDKLPAEHVFEQGIDNLTKFGPYLCTGYDIYLTDEPCLMCAMALIHSRARRVYFVRQSHGNGALLTHFKLQDIKELNHHYEVFQCINS